MRRLPAGVAVSVAIHAAAVALVVEVDASAPALPPTAAPRVELVPPAPTPPAAAEPAPIEVTFFDGAPDATPASRELAMAATTSRGAEPSRPDTHAPATTPPGTPPPGTPTAPGRNPLFDMRRGTTPSLRELGVGRATDYGAALDAIVPPGTGAKPDVPATGALHPDGGGSFRHDEGVFHAKIAPDGSVTMRDGKNLRVHVPLAHPRAVVRGVGRAIADWYHDDNKGVGFLGRPHPGSPETRINLNEAIEGQFNGKEAYGGNRVIDPGQAPIPIMGGSFDITDGLMRRHKMDPYASRKLAFLDATRDERVALGQRHRAEQRAHAARIMKQNLDRLAAAVPDPAARKQALFELWDECLETGGEADVTAGAASRALVIGFIRAHHPAGSAAAYTREELAALNARKQSRAVFAPYE